MAKNLQHNFIKIGKNKISTYQDFTPNKQIAVLFSRIWWKLFWLNSTRFRAFKKIFNYHCELPAHGKSSLNTFQNIQDFQKFYQKLISKLEEFGEIDLIVGHSFSSYFVSDAKISKKNSNRNY